MKILLLILFPVVSFAGGFMKTSDIGKCGSYTAYTSKEVCEKNQVSCAELPNKYACQYHVLNNGVVVVDNNKKTAFDNNEAAKAADKQSRDNKKTARVSALKNCANNQDISEKNCIKEIIKYLIEKEFETNQL